MINLRYAILGSIIPIFVIFYYTNNIIDAVSAEKTISMWIHDEGFDEDWDSQIDGSTDNHYYKLKK